MAKETAGTANCSHSPTRQPSAAPLSLHSSPTASPAGREPAPRDTSSGGWGAGSGKTHRRLRERAAATPPQPSSACGPCRPPGLWLQEPHQSWIQARAQASGPSQPVPTESPLLAFPSALLRSSPPASQPHTDLLSLLAAPYIHAHFPALTSKHVPLPKGFQATPRALKHWDLSSLFLLCGLARVFGQPTQPCHSPSHARQKAAIWDAQGRGRGPGEVLLPPQPALGG